MTKTAAFKGAISWIASLVKSIYLEAFSHLCALEVMYDNE